MMYIIVGTDAVARGKRRRSLLKSLRAEELQWQEMSVEEIGSLLSTPTLMGDTRAFLLVGALMDPECGEEFLALAKGAAGLPHTLVFEEEKLLKTLLTQLQKIGAQVEILEAATKKEIFNVFALANALTSRDRKGLWLLLMRALRSGVAPENVAGILHWKVRELLTSSRAQKYSREELMRLSRELVTLYHDSHRGAGELALLLERFALTL